MNPEKEARYRALDAESDRIIEEIISSSSARKIVVAGPGTGKTHLFKKALLGKNTCLTLTFVNALVEDLSLDLYGLSEVKTLHSYARSELSKATRRGVKIYPKLAEVIKQDARILLGEDIDFDFLFHNRKDSSPSIEFYKARKHYYGGYYGFSDVIFALVKYLESNPAKVPLYDQLLVDEFQDFNRLEISLIDLLSEKTPVLLTGDDDQALYETLKSASTKHIRERFSASRPDYATFSLPYCRRCTKVIVDAANDVISGATRAGLLAGRVAKRFEYFECEEKDPDSDMHQKIVYSHQFANRIPWFIQTRISKIAKGERGKFDTLIIAPTYLQCQSIAEALNEKGFANVSLAERRGIGEPTVLDGLKITLDDPASNLGWRIVSKCLLDNKDFDGLLRATHVDGAKNIKDIIPTSKKERIQELVGVVRGIRDRRPPDAPAVISLSELVGIDSLDLAISQIRDEIESTQKRVGDPGLRKIPIKITTIESSKGLSADYVFITYFDDQYFVREKDKTKISNKDVCNFLVALTRAKKKVFLISSRATEEPTFLGWINPESIERI